MDFPVNTINRGNLIAQTFELEFGYLSSFRLSFLAPPLVDGDIVEIRWQNMEVLCGDKSNSTDKLITRNVLCGSPPTQNI